MKRGRTFLPFCSQRSFPSIGYKLFKTILIGSKFTKIIVFLNILFSFFFNNILVVLYCFWHIFTSFHSFSFIILLLIAFMLRLQPANMPLDGSFDVWISFMNRRNIARLSNEVQFPDCCFHNRSFSWELFSSLKREAFVLIVSAQVLSSSLPREVIVF